jgi:hypothetical protein
MTLFVFLLNTSLAFAQFENWTLIETERATKLEIKISSSSSPQASVLIVAPGQSCNSKGPLFESIEKEALKQNVNVVRFDWSYCSPGAPNRAPSNDLSSEALDLKFVVEFARGYLGKSKTNVNLAGKSLGSIVAYNVFRQDLEFKKLSLLTPVCSYDTDETGKPLPQPYDAIEENYPNLANEKRNIQLISGDQDNLCRHSVLKKFEMNVSNPDLEIIYAKGNHGFYVANSDGSTNQEESLKNITIISQEMLNWFLK